MKILFPAILFLSGCTVTIPQPTALQPQQPSPYPLSVQFVSVTNQSHVLKALDSTGAVQIGQGGQTLQYVASGCGPSMAGGSALARWFDADHTRMAVLLGTQSGLRAECLLVLHG